MKKTRLIILFLVLFSCAAELYATAQYPDKIFYNGKEYDLHSNPLEPYFGKFPNKRPKDGLRSSALWRGYVATFEIVNNSLLLKDIQVMVEKKGTASFETEWKSVLSNVVPKNQKLKIDWLTGLLVIPYGELVNYVHMGYGSTYENYILLEIANGGFKQAKEFNYKQYEEFKERQFAAFKKTEEYQRLVKEISKRESSTPEFIESFLRNSIIDYTSKILVD